ncbi:hypothetical protein SUGI_0123460 [Cryptomeria japonica]|nr:hypothetical protein SUGI_0123460 [Cryptomeria japonica]
MEATLEAGYWIPPEAQHAIASATLRIAIFSPNYAPSPRCLAELFLMLKTGKSIIPIFYHVDPFDLRCIRQGKGKYAPAFAEHEKKGSYTPEKLDEWKSALYDISCLSGDQINSNEDGVTAVNNILHSVFELTKKNPFVGLDELVQGFESVAEEEKVKITGIVGMGGSGKTTLAKELFERNFSSFERYSFVFDVREAASRSALPGKQKKLLADLGVHHSPFDHVDEGKVILANRLSSHRALIVLDDVDHIDQLNALLPNKDNLGFQSVVIVTTRELGVLISWGLSCIFKMPGLSMPHAKELFCGHAFLQLSPPAEFETLVEEFVRACYGSPLSLKVLGAQLYGRSKDYWKSQLRKISRILPGDIKQRLQVSYDALNEEERDMFLDVACFLIGEKKHTAIAVWDGSGWNGLYGLQTLVNNGLVELVDEELIDGEQRIKMHDHLRDLGREIANRQWPHRLWSPCQIDNMKHSTDRNPIRGMQPAESFVAFKRYTHQSIGFSSRRSKRLRFSNKLQILFVRGNEFTEEFASLSQDLVWLRWEGFQLRNIPSWLTLKNLSVLELHAANELEELWQNIADPPLELRELILSGCSKLQRLPSSIGRLQRLKRLDIDFHGSSLSEEFCGLRSLEYLRLYSPLLSSLPAGFGNLISLRNINLWCCKQLSMLPDSFSQLIRLKNLDLSSCEMLSSLPDDFGNLKSLRNISFYNCKQLSMLPDSFSQLRHLTDLHFSSCNILSSLPKRLPLSLKNLKIINCDFLTTVMCISSLINLETLEIFGCRQMEELPSFADLTSLKRFKMWNCPEVEKIEGLEPANSVKIQSFSYYFYD